MSEDDGDQQAAIQSITVDCHFSESKESDDIAGAELRDNYIKWKLHAASIFKSNVTHTHRGSEGESFENGC